MSSDGVPSKSATPVRRYLRRVPSQSNPASGITAGRHPLVQSAAARVAVRWRETVPEFAPNVAEMLRLLASSVEQQLTNPAAPVDERLRSSLGGRLLVLLRSEVLRSWSEKPTGHAAVREILTAIERVREASEPPGVDVAACLSPAEGLELAVDIAHDLRSPLTSILFLAEALHCGQSGPLNELQRRQLGLISCAALGLSAVTNDIIDTVRGSGHLLELEPAAFSVSAVLESVCDIVRPVAEEKRLAVRLESPVHDRRLGYPTALSRVLLNLTTNALKFTDRGSVEVVARERGPVRVEFGVRDTGKGIDVAIVDTLYQPLRPVVGRAGRRFSQTGLGLTMCRKLVTAMGAQLQVETRHGWGTRFFFELSLPTYSAATAAHEVTTPRVQLARGS